MEEIDIQTRDKSRNSLFVPGGIRDINGKQANKGSKTRYNDQKILKIKFNL